MRCVDCEIQNEEKVNVEFFVRIFGIYYVVIKVWFEMCRKKIICDKDFGVGFIIRVFFFFWMCWIDVCNYLNYIDKIYKLNKYLFDVDFGRQCYQINDGLYKY